MAWIVKAAAGVAILLLLLQAGAQLLQRRLMYFPDKQRYTPADAGLGTVEEIEIATQDGERVLAWWGRAQPGKPTLLYFHGNAGSLETRSERIRKYMARGYGIMMMTYRGFGGSTGVPSEKANVADAMAAYETLRSRGVDPEAIVLYGESLGSGVAIQVAAAKEVAGLVLDAPYTSMLDLAGLHYPALPAGLFMTDRYESARHIAGVTAPLLIVHGEADDIIPVEMGRKLAALATAPVEIVTFKEAGHSDHYLHGSYDVIFTWLDRLGARRSSRAAE